MESQTKRVRPEADGDSLGLYGSRPAVLPAPSECFFYQTIDIPGHGVQPGQWDLREGQPGEA